MACELSLDTARNLTCQFRFAETCRLPASVGPQPFIFVASDGRETPYFDPRERMDRILVP